MAVWWIAACVCTCLWCAASFCIHHLVLATVDEHQKAILILPVAVPASSCSHCFLCMAAHLNSTHLCFAAIDTQPMNTDAELGTTITLSVVVTGYDTFQWFGPGDTMLNNGGRISGADTDTLTITNAMTTDAGDYFVNVAMGASPAVQSNTATVRVECT